MADVIFAATGHRPDKLGGYSEFVDKRLRFLATRVFTLVRPQKVISGMALGWDMAFAEAADELQIPFCAAIPFTGQEGKWPQRSQDRYKALLKRASHVQVCSTGGYAPFKMQTRNEWMVLQCDRLIALWNGSSGGTANCVAFAQAINREVSNLWPAWVHLTA